MLKKNQKHNKDASLTASETTEVLAEVITFMDKRFNSIEDHLAAHDVRFDELEKRLGDKIDGVNAKVTGLSGRVEQLEDDMRLVKTKLAIQ